jgi:S1-C subfamily serine protease
MLGMSGWARRSWAAAWLLLPAAAARGQDPEPAQAAAYLRVFGDWKAEFKHVYKPALERHDVELATGSGFVISPSGLVLTNQHVVAGQSQERQVDGELAQVVSQTTHLEAVIGAGEGRRTLPAAVVASDPELDLALLSVTAGDLPFLRFGDSDATEPGQPARVLGFPFGRQLELARTPGPSVAPDVTVSVGRIGAARADDSGVAHYLQTDASVAPGSSGGPMLDLDNYVLGIVRSRLGRSGGPGFAIAINRVKDFLEDNGFLSQLPARRLRLGPPQASPWKGVRLSLPGPFDDSSRSRLRILGGELEEAGTLTVDRVLSPLPLAQFEEALLNGELDGVRLARRAAATATGRELRGLFGSANAVVDGAPVRVEYALLDLGPEKLAARFVAPPDQVAFNLSVIRASLQSLEAERILTDALVAPASAELNPTTLRDPRAPEVAMPARFVTDETPGVVCPLAPAASVLSASPAGDFSVSFRVYFTPEAIEPAAECPAEWNRFGVAYRGRSLTLRRDEGLLRFEVEAPAAKFPLIDELARAWLERARRGGGA